MGAPCAISIQSAHHAPVRGEDGDKVANNTARTVALALVAGAILPGPPVSARAQEIIPNLAVPSHVRSFSPSISSVIQQAGERSVTFRHLVETINASDSYVYIDEDECMERDMRACLVNVTVGGPYRFMFVHVATHKVDWDLMGSIGHELRHAIEVIDNPSVTSVRTMRSLYAWIGKKSSRYRDLYETDAAIDAGNAVRDEVRAFISSREIPMVARIDRPPSRAPASLGARQE